jgi:CubicO group peptidase (beta-lactamase class C family)
MRLCRCDCVGPGKGERKVTRFLTLIFRSWVWALASLAILLPLSASAQTKTTAANLTATDLEPWLDGFMVGALRANEVQGAAVAVVKDGKVLVQKGYGFADAAKRIPVDPENTLFRPGSISKLFVWTSIMQLVEQGKIDLDADINTYLDFKIAGMGGAKITVRHLMTHRAGFEEVGKSAIFNDPALLRPLGSTLKSYVPRRIFAPGSTAAYSNYGASLAGYILQRVSGMPFEAYVERNIFTPLGIVKSTFRQPLPRALQPFMSKGYDVAGGDAQPFELLNDGPAGALSASTADMVRFMIAHLNAERATDSKLLKPETARLMHRSVIKNFPELNGMALGFYENNVNGRKVIAHGGDLNWFHSDLLLFIDDGIGIYISMNSAGNGALDIRSRILQEFADRYVPTTALKSTVDESTAALHLKQVAGAYVATRRLESSFGRLGNLLAELSISSGDGGALVLSGFGKPMRFREIRPFLWQEVDGNERLSVKMKDGRPVSMAVNAVSPIMEFSPVGFMHSASVILPVILASVMILAITILSWPLGAVAKRWYGIAPAQSADQRRLFNVRQLASLGLMVSIIVWVALIIPRMSGFSEADNTQILITQAVSMLCVSIAVVCMLLVGRDLFKVKKTVLKTAGTVVWLTAIIALIWFYYSFNLLKFGTGL